MDKIIIGTRGSELALWQARFIQGKLQALTDLPVEISIIKTQGDKIDNVAFSKIEGKGFFTKELEEALLTGTIDLAVHSLKDLMTTLPGGLMLAAVCFREDNREALLVRKDSFDPDCPFFVKKAGKIGSGSVRRQCQIFHLSPDLQLKDIRGNVPTRIRKLREGKYDAILLAYAGIKRLKLDLSDLEVKILDTDRFLPAPAQGILGIETSSANNTVNQIMEKLDDPLLRTQVRLERGLLARFEGGCQLPLGVASHIDHAELELHAVLGESENGRWIGLRSVQLSGTDPEHLTLEAYNRLTGTVS